MLAVFCLRLCLGLLASLLLLSPSQVNPRFFRTHCLTVLGLTAVAAVFLQNEADGWLWLALISTMLLTFAGSVVWMLEGAPAGRGLVLLALGGAAASLIQAAFVIRPAQEAWWLVDEFTSAAVLGAATTAMLIGHSYLIAPAMSLTPLKRMLAALAVFLLLRLLLAGLGLWQWTTSAPTDNLETVLWLAARWGIGLVAPLGLTWMAWQTAKIRSTQSATGILYVVVILCFLGELTALLLRQKLNLIL